MRIAFQSAVLVFALAVSQPSAMAEEAAAPVPTAPESVYVKMDYMHLADSTARQYFELELGEWRPIQAQRIRAGVTTAWYFYEVMPGARPDGDQPYDYITVSVFGSYEKVFDNAGTEAIFQVYPGVELEDLYDRADTARDFVRSDLWKLTQVVSPDHGSKPVSEYLSVTFLESSDGEEPAVGETHADRIRQGALNSAAAFLLRNPPEEEREYDGVIIEYFDSLTDLLASRGDDPGAAYKTQIWRLIDAIEAADIE
jgi:hypothetical protein